MMMGGNEKHIRKKKKHNDIDNGEKWAQRKGRKNVKK